MKAGLIQKSMAPGIVGAIIVSVLMALLVYKFETDASTGQARVTATAVAAEVAALRQVYARNIVNKLKKEGIPIKPGTQTTYRDTPGGIPLPATFVHETNDIINNKSKTHSVELKSLWPLNPKKGPATEFEKDALKFVVDNPRETKEQVIEDRFFYVSADVASDESCVNCHNADASSPKRDFQINDVMGGVIVSVPLGPAIAQAKSMATKVTIYLVLCIIMLLAIQFSIQYFTIQKPMVTSLNELERAAEQISLGKVDDPVEINAPTAEIARLSTAFERMRVSLQAAMKYFERDEENKGGPPGAA